MRRGGGQTVWRSVGRLASALRSAGPPVRLTALLLLSACQPAARRLLLLDLALSDPVLLNGTARPWRDQGYTVEYRRFYPHLARVRSEEHTSELQSRSDLVCRLLLEKKKQTLTNYLQRLRPL